MNEERKYIDFESCERVAEPHKRERVSAWRTAIGLQDVDGLRVSEYLIETAIKHIEGDIIQYWSPLEIEQVIIPKQLKSIQEIISAKTRKNFAINKKSQPSLEMVKKEIGKGGGL